MATLATSRLTALLLVALAGAGCTVGTVQPSATMTTLMPDSERWFRISWEVTPQGDERTLSGYVENLYGEAAGKVQLLAQALDQSGTVVGQRIQWVPGIIVGFGRVYYEIRHLPPAAQYRVTVWAYERIQGRDGGLVIR